MYALRTNQTCFSREIDYHGLIEPVCRNKSSDSFSRPVDCFVSFDTHSLVIISPDCGKNLAFRGRCPKCAGNSWIPAGNAGGIFERMKAQRLRRMIGEENEVSESQSLRVSEETEQTG